MISAIDLAAVTNVRNCDCFLRVIDLVDNAVVSKTDSPAFTFGQLFASGWSGIFLQFPNFRFLQLEAFLLEEPPTPSELAAR